MIRNFTAQSNVPKGKDFKVTDDGVMVADRGFKKQLWALDEELDVVWDWGSEKWEIWRFPGQKGIAKKRVDNLAHHVLTVQTKNRTFRELGADILIQLQKGDPQRFSLKELVNYFDKMDDNIQRAKRKAFKNHLESIRIDNARIFRGSLLKQVPRSFGIKESDKKHLLNVTPRELKSNIPIFKPSNTFKVARALGGV
jgi:hypothetical protein